MDGHSTRPSGLLLERTLTKILSTPTTLPTIVSAIDVLVLWVRDDVSVSLARPISTAVMCYAVVVVIGLRTCPKSKTAAVSFAGVARSSVKPALSIRPFTNVDRGVTVQLHELS